VCDINNGRGGCDWHTEEGARKLRSAAPVLYHLAPQSSLRINVVSGMSLNICPSVVSLLARLHPWLQSTPSKHGFTHHQQCNQPNGHQATRAPASKNLLLVSIVRVAK